MQEIERSRLSIHPAIRHPYKHASDACARHINCLVLRIRLWNSMDPMGAPKDCDLLMKAPPLQTAARQRWRRNHDTTRHIRWRGGVAYFMFHRTRIQCVFTPSHAHRIRENSPTRGAKKASACRGGAAHVDPSSIGWKTSVFETLFKDFLRYVLLSSFSFFFQGWWIKWFEVKEIVPFPFWYINYRVREEIYIEDRLISSISEYKMNINYENCVL